MGSMFNILSPSLTFLTVSCCNLEQNCVSELNLAVSSVPIPAVGLKSGLVYWAVKFNALYLYTT